MNKTKIEYLDYCWNFMTGCTNYQKPYICGGDKDFECWAKAMAKRFGRNFTPRFNDKLLYDMIKAISNGVKYMTSGGA